MNLDELTNICNLAALNAMCRYNNHKSLELSELSNAAFCSVLETFQSTLQTASLSDISKTAYLHALNYARTTLDPRGKRSSSDDYCCREYFRQLNLKHYQNIDLLLDISTALSNLSDEELKIVKDIFLLEEKQREVAAKLRISQPTLSIKINKILEKLRTKLREYAK